MRFADLAPARIPAAESLTAVIAAILEADPTTMPVFEGGDPAAVGMVSRWLGRLGLGAVRVADPAAFSWPGPWIARIRPPAGDERFVLMYGVPSGAIWDPAGDGAPVDNAWVVDGYLLAAADIALARPPLPEAPVGAGRIEAIYVSATAGQAATPLASARALPGLGLDGDRHVTGDGTFPSGLPGSALTLIEAEVCESFDPRSAPTIIAATSSPAESPSTTWSATSSPWAPCAARGCGCASRARWCSATPGGRCCARWCTAAACAPTS